MKLLLVACVLMLAGSGLASGQWPQITLERVRQIKLLTSGRDAVQKVLAEYEPSDNDPYWQTFSNDGVTVEISYSSGRCPDSSDDAEAGEIWSVPESRVVKIELSFEQPLRLKDTHIDISKFEKELRRKGDDEDFFLYSKADGIAIHIGNGGVSEIIIFPRKLEAKKLCSTSGDENEFYSTKGKFASSIFEPHLEPDHDRAADVTELELDGAELSATTGKLISVITTAVDPENDVLTYNYIVSAGKIIGSGARVTWDLSGISPGSYTITAAVDDGCGVCGQTKTKTVTVK